MPVFTPLIAILMVKSMARRNENGERMQSCCMPVLILMNSVIPPSILTQQLEFRYGFWEILMKFWGMVTFWQCPIVTHCACCQMFFWSQGNWLVVVIGIQCSVHWYYTTWKFVHCTNVLGETKLVLLTMIFHWFNQPFEKDDVKDFAKNQEKHNASPVAAFCDIFRFW